MAEIDWHRLPPLSTLRAFEATARLGGYSAAARSLNVTPAAIAQQVRKLETEIGAPLVRREGRGLALTETGEKLAAPLRDAFDRIARGVEGARAHDVPRSVRVSTTFFFGDAMILPRIGEFWAANPGVQVSFTPDGNLKPVDLDAYDICVRGGHLGETWPGHAVRQLLHCPIIVCAAPSLLDRAKGDLASLPWIRDRSIPEQDLRNFTRMAGFERDKIQLVDPGSAKFEIDAAVMGYGLSISTELVVRKHLQEGSLVWVDTPLDVTATYSVITRKGRLPDAVQAFLDWLTEICAEDRPFPRPSGRSRSAPSTTA